MLHRILSSMGFGGGVSIRYSYCIDMVVFFMGHRGVNPAVTLSGTIISVGFVESVPRSRVDDNVISNPLNARFDFNLVCPDSLDDMERCLGSIIDRCESGLNNVY